MLKVANTDTKVVTGKIRMNYVNLFRPRIIGNGVEPQYSLVVLIPKSDSDTVDKIQKAVAAAETRGLRMWGGQVPENMLLPLQDGDTKMPEQQEYEGHYFLNASTKYQPGIIDRNLRKITDPAETYSGCYGRVSLRFYPFSREGKNGIGCGLVHVQKLEDGESLDGRSSAEEDFAESLDDLLE